MWSLCHTCIALPVVNQLHHHPFPPPIASLHMQSSVTLVQHFPSGRTSARFVTTTCCTSWRRRTSTPTPASMPSFSKNLRRRRPRYSPTSSRLRRWNKSSTSLLWHANNLSRNAKSRTGTFISDNDTYHTGFRLLSPYHCGL